MTIETILEDARKIQDPRERLLFLSKIREEKPEFREQIDRWLDATPLLSSPLGSSGPMSPGHTDVPGDFTPHFEATGDFTPNLQATRDFSPDSSPKTAASEGTNDLGTVLAGRYRLIKILGEGGMGTVYIAEQSEPVKRQVALKLIKAGLDSRAVLARFEAERQALALMDHPNIARVYDGGTTPRQQPFFVMELVKGVPITEYCDAQRLPVKSRLELMVAVCNAVQHAHQKGIIHRDLKPGNVLVTEVDGRPTPKVIDFGVAKATEQNLTELSFSDVGAIVGTPAYMSPEQADPSMDIDTRTDVYALGVILYELLVGSPPIEAKQFRKGALLEMFRMVREVDPPKPSTRLTTSEGLPGIASNRNIEPAKLARLLKNELDWIVLKALEKDRTRRYGTANGFAADIQRYLCDEPVEARPPSRKYLLMKFVKRNKVQVTAAALVLLALVGGIIGTGIGMVRAENARESEATQRGLAENLAVKNGELADQERKAKDEARELASKNEKLAISESLARRESEKQLDRTRAVLFNSQMDRVGAILEKDPMGAMELLNDLDACPRNLRDMAWAFAEKSARRRDYASFPIPLAYCQAISPDGKWLAVGDLVRVPGRPPVSKVTVFDVATGKVRIALPQFTDSVELLEFSPDGNRLAVVADGPLNRQQGGRIGPDNRPAPVPGKVQIWRIDTGKLENRLEGHTDRITSMKFDSSGNRLVTGSLDKTARLWDVNKAQSEHTFDGHQAGVTAVAMTGDGKRLATGGLDNRIRIWDLETRKPKESWTPSANPDPDLATFRKNRQSLGISGQGRNYILGQPGDSVIDLDFNEDGSALVSCNSNWLMEIRDTGTGLARTTIRDLKYPAWWVRFHRDGKSVIGYQRQIFISQQQVPAVKRWDVATGALLYSLPVSLKTGPAAYCRDQGFLATSMESRSVIQDLDATPELAALTTGPFRGSSAVPAFSRTGDLLAVGLGKSIKVWNVRNGSLLYNLEGHANRVQCLSVSPDGKTLASSALTPIALGEERTVDDIRLWDLTTGKAVARLPIASQNVPSIAFNNDGSALAAVQVEAFGLGNPKVLVSVWDVKTQEKRFSREHPDMGFAGYVFEGAEVAFHPVDGTLISSAGHSLCIWDLKDQKPGRTIRTGRLDFYDPSTMNEFVGLAVSPDGGTLVTVNQTGGANTTSFDLNQWDLGTGELIRKVRNFGGKKLRFSPDGRNLISAANGRLEFWDTQVFQRRGSVPIHPMDGSIAIALSPDGQTIASTWTEQVDLIQPGTRAAVSVKLWDASRTPVVLSFPGKNNLEISFSPDGKVAIETDRSQGRTRFWDLKSARLISSVDTTKNSLDGVPSPDGRFMAGADVGGTMEDKFAAKIRIPETNLLKLSALLTLFDIQANSLRQFEVAKGVIMAHRFSPDGKKVGILLDQSVGDGSVLKYRLSVLMWNIAENRIEASYPFPDGFANGGISFSPDGKFLAAPVYEVANGKKSQKVFVIDLAGQRALPSLDLKASDNLTRTVLFTPDSNRLVIRRGPENGELTLWDVKTGTRLNEPVPDLFSQGNLSPDGRYQVNFTTSGVDILDRTMKPPPVINQRRVPR